ncbi:MAG: VRR-NUC domain-containing protein, partial [Actinobacteria bacterium]|nr:VRR-NUC domain-containing protein [Actinomycetota bacterium]
MSEGALQDRIRLALGRDPELVVFRNNCGRAEIRGSWVVYGVGTPGGSDLIAIYRGRAFFLEIKTPTGKQSEEQATFQRLVEGKGAEYRIFRSVKDAEA